MRNILRVISLSCLILAFSISNLSFSQSDSTLTLEVEVFCGGKKTHLDSLQMIIQSIDGEKDTLFSKKGTFKKKISTNNLYVYGGVRTTLNETNQVVLNPLDLKHLDTKNLKPGTVIKDTLSLIFLCQTGAEPICFSKDSTGLTLPIKVQVAQLKNYISDNPQTAFTVIGTSNADEDPMLSEKRAKNVYHYLLSSGIDSTQITWKGLGYAPYIKRYYNCTGKHETVYDQDYFSIHSDHSLRRLNRRVSIVVKE